MSPGRLVPVQEALGHLLEQIRNEPVGEVEESSVGPHSSSPQDLAPVVTPQPCPTVHILAALLFLIPYLRLEAPLYSFAYFKNFHKSLSLAGSCYFPAGVFACALANHLAVK